MNSDSVMPSRVSITVDADPEAPIPYSESSPGDTTLSFTLPSAEYMYGCGATAVGMLIGYYDLYGYYANGVRYTLGALIPGTISVNSRGSDGGSIYDMKDPSKLANFIASAGYIKRFYDKTPSQEKSYTFLYGSVGSGLNTGAWDCLADYLGTGQYWRGNDDLSTRHYNDVTLEDLNKSSWPYTVDGTAIPSEYIDFKYGLSLYVQSVGYELDAKKTRSATKENFSFDDFRKEIDADHPVLIHLYAGSSGHVVTAYGYNSSTKEIIFDDTYRSNCRMYWDGSYKYSGKYYKIKAISTVAFVTSSLTQLKSEVLSVKANITTPTNGNVTITATFNEYTTTKQYSLDQSKWYNCNGSVTVTQNGKVYLRGISISGTPSSVTVYSVTNIDKTAPNKPVATANTTAPTNQNVIVTATFSSDTAKKQYSLDNATWQSYSSALTATKNRTYYFRAIDSVGNVSGVTAFKVANIDREAPNAPKLKSSTTKATNKNVTITATFSNDSVGKQYSPDNKNWQDCSGSVSVDKNGTYYFRGIDAAGNASKAASIKVANIDKTPPTAPKLKASTTKPTNKKITVTATFSKDSAKKQYSLDNKTWSTYSKALSVGKNGTYYFRGIDAAGNVSAAASIVITNIDKEPPAAPTAKASTTQVTNKNITVTATYSADSAKKQYSTDKKTWKTYSKALSVGKNGTYYFRGIDAAGNASKVASIKITNVDKTPPTAPKLKTNTTKATNKNVTITAAFSKDSVVKQYSTDKKNWENCSNNVSVGKNGTYYFRSIDAAGNVSKVTGIKVKNIDKTAPVAPTIKVSSTKATNKSVTLTATFSKDSAKKQYSLDGKSWKNYTKPLTLKSNTVVSFRGIDAVGNISQLKTVVVDNIMDTGNNSWSNATLLAGSTFAAVDDSFDQLDCYDVDNASRIDVSMERGKITATLCKADGTPVACTMYDGSGGKISATSFEIDRIDDPTPNSRYFVGISAEVKFLRIEAAASGVNSYRLASTLA